MIIPKPRKIGVEDEYRRVELSRNLNKIKQITYVLCKQHYVT